MKRFLDDVWRYVEGRLKTKENKPDIYKKFFDKSSGKKISMLLHKTIKKVSGDIENFKFNTAISQLMILRNSFYKSVIEDDYRGEIRMRGGIKVIGEGDIFSDNISTKDFKKFLILLSPFAPHLAEELWEKLGHKESIFKEKWPTYDKKLAKDETIELVIQVNGKLRDTIEVKANISEKDAKEMALESKKIQKWTKGKKVVKVIFVKGKLVNIVVK